MKDGEHILTDERVTIIEQNTKFSWRKLLIFNTITKNDEGVYKCEIVDTHQQVQERDFHMKVFDAQAPEITPNFDQTQIIQPFGGTLILECLYTGLPFPSIRWYYFHIIFFIYK